MIAVDMFMLYDTYYYARVVTFKFIPDQKKKIKKRRKKNFDSEKKGRNKDEMALAKEENVYIYQLLCIIIILIFIFPLRLLHFPFHSFPAILSSLYCLHIVVTANPFSLVSSSFPLSKTHNFFSFANAEGRMA